MSDPASRSAVLFDRLGISAAEGSDVVDERLRAMLRAARARWPALSMPDEAYIDYVAERVRDAAPGELEAALGRLRAEDLFLACACAAGDASALAAFETAHFSDADGALARLGVRGAAVDDVKQMLRSKLFVGEPGARPKIAEYSGRGELKSWFRIVAVREAISGARKTRREVGLDDDIADGVPGASGDPELVYLRAKYRAEFQDAFRSAMEALSSQERNLLRHHYIDRLSIDRIGAMYRIHRMTAARRLTAIREKLVESTRRRLADHLKLDTAELASVLRLVRSDADVTLRRFLGEAG